MEKNVKKIIVLFICMMIAITFMPFAFGDLDAYAAGKKVRKMTVYTDVIKKGNKVYCMVQQPERRMSGRLYQVNLKTSEVRRLTGSLLRPEGMGYKGGYIYYACSSTDIPLGWLYRVKPGTKSKRLSTIGFVGKRGFPAFALGKNKIYYKEARWSDAKNDVVTKNKQMSLSGKHKKSLANSTFKIKSKKTNTNGYSLIYVGAGGEYDEEDDYYYYDHYNCYLKKPDGQTVFVTKIDENF